MALRLLRSDLHTIDSMHPTNPRECLQAVLEKWLQKGYDHQRYGPPTWKMLVRAVAEPAGGDNITLAEQIARNHQGILES